MQKGGSEVQTGGNNKEDIKLDITRAAQGDSEVDTKGGSNAETKKDRNATKPAHPMR